MQTQQIRNIFPGTKSYQDFRESGSWFASWDPQFESENFDWYI